ncbi:MAG: putative nucleotide-diphospho-sugar transferase [Bacteroidales bacterium]|nr:putative nucleotide-diphospho-sugar transferase [Bacteroidales bacterium]
MKTQAVYIAVSSERDCFFEQVWVSAWSLKYYNPQMRVCCCVDDRTYSNIQGTYRKNALEWIDDLVLIQVPDELPNRERSRWIKTNLRELVEGDFLFIDSDTVICGTLADIDNKHGDVMMVEDYHCNVSRYHHEKLLRKKLKKISGKPYKGNHYYNSGVILCRDTEKSHAFYALWHENWKKTLAKGVVTDQQSLAFTVEDFDCVQPLDGMYNCQLRYSIKYLHKGVILHFFNCEYPLNTSHPFFLPSEYQTVKHDGGLTEDYKQRILNCKSLFEVDTCMAGGKETVFRRDYADVLLFDLYNHNPRVYAFINVCARAFLFLQRSMKRFFKM